MRAAERDGLVVGMTLGPFPSRQAFGVALIKTMAHAV